MSWNSIFSYIATFALTCTSIQALPPKYAVTFLDPENSNFQNSAYVFAFNDAGQFAGIYVPLGKSVTAFLYYSNGTIIDLTLNESISAISAATGVNRHG